MDRDDVRVRESRDCTRLAVKACHRVGIGRQPLWQYLARDIAAESGIPRTIHFTHATGTEGGDDLIRAEARSWGKGQGSFAILRRRRATYAASAGRWRISLRPRRADLPE